MNELLQTVLTDVSARDAASMPDLASSMAETFTPWADVA
ncbi:MAG: hypothetical protein JWL89_685 [Candidatus Saccharibacteria bacterium]|nr:hypothetical protein [Candidatus Saccharibacteria bacterium]